MRDDLADPLPQFLSGFTILVDAGVHCHGGPGEDSQGDVNGGSRHEGTHRLTLGLVRVEEPARPPPMQQRGENPGEVGRIADPGIHPEPTHRRPDMRCVSGEEDVARPVAVGHHAARDPALDTEDLAVDLPVVGGTHRGIDVDVVEVAAWQDDYVNKPVLLAVERHRVGQPVRVDDPVHPCRPMPVLFDEVARTKVHRDGLVEHFVSLQATADGGAGGASPTVAPNSEPCGDALAVTCVDLDGMHDDVIVLVVNCLDLPAVPQRHAGKGAYVFSQDRLKEELADTVLRFRRRPSLIQAPCRLAAHGGRGKMHSRQLVPRPRSEIDDVGGVCGGKTCSADTLGTAQPPEMLHRPRIRRIAFRVVGTLLGALLQEQDRDATPAEVHGECQPNRSSTDDQDRDVDGGAECVLTRHR